MAPFACLRSAFVLQVIWSFVLPELHKGRLSALSYYYHSINLTGFQYCDGKDVALLII